MRKILTLGVFSLLAVTAAFGQKKTTFENTQARALDVQASAYVKPQVADLHILFNGKRQKYTANMTNEELLAIGNTEEAARSRATFDACQKFDCDVIVGATYRILSNSAGTTVDVVGFPANFVNWRPVSSSDIDWLRIEKVAKTTEGEKINAVRK